MKTSVLFTLLICSSISRFYSQKFEWTQTIEGLSSFSEVASVSDNYGNVYSIGDYSGTIDFDPGTGVVNLIANGSNDVFIQKIDSLGNLIWAKSFGGVGQDISYSLSIDAFGNIYTLTKFSQSVSYVYPSSVNIQKLDSSGNLVWRKSFGIYQNINLTSMLVDASGNVYTSGTFNGTIDFDPGTGVVNLISNGGYDAFIQKLNSSGNLVWTKSFGGPNSEIVTSMSLDNLGNVYTSGTFNGTVDFDPGSNSYYLPTSLPKIYVQKLNSLGNLIWVKSFGNSWVNIKSMSVDATGNVYTTGTFGVGTIDFDPGSSVQNLTSNGIDVFIQKLNSSGLLVWARSFGGPNNDGVTSMSLDALGNVYTTGFFDGTADFDPTLGTVNLTSNGGSDVFIQKLNSLGFLVWAKSFGGIGHDFPTSMTLDASGNLFTIGSFDGIVDFDPGLGTFNLSCNSSGRKFNFIQKLDITGLFVWSKCNGGRNSGGIESKNNEMLYTNKSIESLVDDFGNVYTTGAFKGTLDFDPGLGQVFLTSNGNNDIFVQKIDSLGSLIWVKSFGGIGNEIPCSINIDVFGFIYVMGRFTGIVDFDPGLGVSNLTSNGSAFIQKLNSSGNHIWSKTLEPNTGSTEYINIDSDLMGNIYISNNFTSSSPVDFDPGSGTVNLTSNGGHDIAIQKLDSSGNFLWAKSFGGTSSDYVMDMAVDNIGNIYTTGWFHGTVDFDPGSGSTNLTSIGGRDVYIQKLNSSGNFIWAKSFGNNSDYDMPFSLALDLSGNVYTTGRFVGTVDFDPGSGSTSLTPQGAQDIYIQKLNSSGNFLWARSFGNYSNDWPVVISISNTGNIYNTGSFIGSVDFDPSSGISNLSSNGDYDVFIQKFNSNGDFLWAKSFGGSGSDFPISMSLDHLENIYTSGKFTGSVDFNPNNGTENFASSGTSDFFIQKLTPCNSSIGLDVQTACDSYTWINGVTYTSSNNSATHTLTNTNGCDSVVTLNLTISNFSNGTDTQTVCDSYTWINGVTYTSSNNTATQTLTNAAGCDSIVTLNLTINNSNTGTDVQTACNSYTWINGVTYTSSNNSATHTLTNTNGCDSVVTLNLTINNSNTGTDVITACDSYTWINGVTYTSSNNTATQTLTNAAGCDSVVTLNLTINNSNTGTDVQTACNSFTWINGVTYTSSNNSATHTLTNTNGCDSVVTLNLTINNSNTGTDVQTACDSYTWINGVTYTSSNNTATHTLTNAAGCDSIVTLNLTINNSNTGTDVLTACDSYTWINGVTYTSSNNTATQTLTNTSGCDSVVTLNLTINNSNTGTDVITACDSYTWINGVTYTSSNNTATQTLTNAAGCDSIVTLNLTINNSNTGTDTQTACNSYTWINGVTYTSSNNTATQTLTNAQGCDSVVALNLTINNSTTGVDVQTSCDSYTWINGVTYTSSNNTATDTFTNSQGCDSIVTLNLTINPSAAITSQPVNQTVFVGGNAQFQLTASGTGLTYQWQQNNGTGFTDISSFGIYSGTTTNTLTITGVNASIQQNGYRCKISNSTGCSDTTDAAILYISLTGIDENGVEESFKLFPNPTNSQLNIETSITYSSGIIINALGQTVMQFKNETTLDVSHLKAGNYILLIKGENNEVLKTEKFNKY